MFDWVPIKFYNAIYHHVILVVVLLVLFHSQLLKIDEQKNKKFISVIGIFLFSFLVLYMGLRPVHGVFLDMNTYAHIFQRYQDGYPITSVKDPLFNLFMLACAQIMSRTMFFFVCALLYIVPLYIVCKKWFPLYWVYGFLMLITAMSFWAYGVNGIRNGIAGSLFLFAISQEKRFLQILFLLVAANFHSSMLLPTAAFIVVQYHNKPKTFLIFWFLSIPLSLILGGFWENLFSNLGFSDDRIAYLTAVPDEQSFEGTGFRWDFLLYSATGVFAGYYFVFKKKFNDVVYFKLFNIYLFANAFWILVIRANFSNRFAYLSWFMLALVIIYPLLKKVIVPRQHKLIGLIILGHVAFTYVLNVIFK